MRALGSTHSLPNVHVFFPLEMKGGVSPWLEPLFPPLAPTPRLPIGIDDGKLFSSGMLLDVAYELVPDAWLLSIGSLGRCMADAQLSTIITARRRFVHPIVLRSSAR